MKILVTGATGFIGSRVEGILVEKGHEVIGISRKIEDREYNNGKLKHIKLDATNKDEFGKLDNFQIDAIINCLGVLGKFGLPDDVYIKTNVQTTTNLLEFSKTKGVKHFIHMSSCGVVGPIIKYECPANECYHGAPSNIYEQSKWLAEEEVKISGLNGVDYTIIRPEFVYGPGDLHVLGLFKAISSGKFILIDGGESYLHPTYIDDITSAVILTLFNRASYGKTLNIVGDRYIAVKDLANMISSKLHKKIEFKNIPSSILLPITMAIESSHLFANPPLTTSQVKFFTECRSFTYENAKNTIGYVPTTTLEEGIDKTIKWYLQNGYLEYNFKISDLNISNLFETATLEGEGWGTAYEYYSKLPYLNKSFENEKNIEVMILGLPEKYGYSMDFILYCYLNSVKKIFVFDERKEKIDNFSRLLKDINKNITKRLGMIPDIDIYNINSWNELENYHVDITLSCEVLQRLDSLSKEKYINFITNNTRKCLIFVPNGKNNAHKTVSSLRSLYIDELTGMVANKTKLIDFGYVDCPPNPPGITLNKNKKLSMDDKNKKLSMDDKNIENEKFTDKLKGFVIYTLLSTWYIVFEKNISFVLKNFFESNAHIVFVVCENGHK